MRLKELLPTALGSAEVREQIAADILRRSVVSARMTSARHLARIRDVAADFAAGRINAAEARSQLLRSLAALGHAPSPDGADGGLADPTSERRLNLILETQRHMAASVARLSSETPDTLDAYPAWELTRMDAPAEPRKDWAARWRAAGDSVGWQGARRGVYYGSGVGIAFAALKSSPIWAALGSGAGGFRDTLGNPFPPFAYGSYMDWADLDRGTAEELGLIAPGEPASAPAAASLSPDDAELLDAARRVGWPGLFDDLR